eukprot:666668-Prymnesium_polylepis.1
MPSTHAPPRATAARSSWERLCPTAAHSPPPSADPRRCPQSSAVASSETTERPHRKPSAHRVGARPAAGRQCWEALW